MEATDIQYASFASFSLGDFSDWSESSDFDPNESAESLSVDYEEELISRKVVRFGSVHVRTHKVTLGDVSILVKLAQEVHDDKLTVTSITPQNPSCSQGAPLSLAWTPIKSDRFGSLEEFERVFGSPNQVQRISVKLREEWLQKNGHSLQSLKVAANEIATARKESARCSKKVTDHWANDCAANSKFSNDSLHLSPHLPKRQKTPPAIKSKLRMQLHCS
jgi:hypothetical protein